MLPDRLPVAFCFFCSLFVVVLFCCLCACVRACLTVCAGVRACVRVCVHVCVCVLYVVVLVVVVLLLFFWGGDGVGWGGVERGVIYVARDLNAIFYVLMHASISDISYTVAASSACTVVFK